MVQLDADGGNDIQQIPSFHASPTGAATDVFGELDDAHGTPQCISEASIWEQI